MREGEPKPLTTKERLEKLEVAVEGLKKGHSEISSMKHCIDNGHKFTAIGHRWDREDMFIKWTCRLCGYRTDKKAKRKEAEAIEALNIPR